MNYSLSLSLGGGSLTFDLDAKAYIAAVVAAGGTVSATQRAAINDFYRAGKGAGWYSSIKRLYLPIWAAAAPNAICMTSLTSGTFVGNVTHSTGFVATTSPTGHFLANATPASLGLTSNNAFIFSMAISGAQEFIGCGNGVGGRLVVGRVGLTLQGTIPSVSTIATGTSDTLGAIMGCRVGNVTSLYQRKASGFVTPVNTTNVDAAALPAFAPAFLGNFSASGTVTTARTTVSEYAAYGYGLGLSSGNAEAFTLALQNIWEASTGLTLP